MMICGWASIPDKGTFLYGVCLCGFSLSASKFKDVQIRSLIVDQASLNVNVNVNDPSHWATSQKGHLGENLLDDG